MIPTLGLVLLAGVLVGAGVYLVTDRTFTGIVIGLALIGNGSNIALLAAGGAAGAPPILGTDALSSIADPLPQAMILTSIVITMATTAFMLALAFREWILTGGDEVVDDVEDRRLARRAATGRGSERIEDAPETEDEDSGQDEDQADRDDKDEAEGEDAK